MKKLCFLLLTFTMLVWAADFWASKPYTDWGPKEVQKMLTESPWSHRVDVELKVNMPDLKSQSESGGRGRGGGGGSRGLTTADGNDSLTGGGGRAPEGIGLSPDSPSTQTLPLMLIWETALPVKQARVKARLGAEAATADEAKAFLGRAEEFYVLTVAGFPLNSAPAFEGDKKTALLEATALNIKGKPALHPMEVQVSRRDRAVDALFLFPRTTPITLDDKDLEFATKVGRLNVKYHFRLKDMVFQNKLEL